MRILSKTAAAAVCVAAGLALGPTAQADPVSVRSMTTIGWWPSYQTCETAEDAYLMTHREATLARDCWEGGPSLRWYFSVYVR